MSRHVSNYVCDFQSRGILSARPYRLKAEAIAEVDAEDLVRADDYYHSRPYFRCADKQDFYKKPVLCAAHVVGIADPVKYRKSNNSQEPKVVRKGWNGQELKMQSQKPEFFLEHMDRRVGGESSDFETPAEALYNAQDMLVSAIRTAADAEKHMCRIAVARAEVVSL